MKKITFILLLTCMFLLSLSMENASAEYSHAVVPLTYSGHTYNHYMSYAENNYNTSRRDWVFENLSNVVIGEYHNPGQTSVTCTYTRRMTRLDGGSWTQYSSGVCGLNLWLDQTTNGGYVATNFPGISTVPMAQLTININPSAGGTVTSDPAGIDCPGTSCEAGFTYNSEVDIEAYPETDWAFAYWDNGTTNLYSNPLTVTMDSAKTLTAKFFGTFRNAAGDFRQSSGDGDECVIYVRNETDILYAACNGEAADCFSQAQSVGYSTGSAPRIGSIIVFNRASGALSSGHVGIVTNINGTEITIQDSNWVAYHTIGNHTVDVSGYSIAGYIYYTP